MSDLTAVDAVLRAGPPQSVVELRDVLRARGQVSITSADVHRVLVAHPARFVSHDIADGAHPYRRRWRARVEEDRPLVRTPRFGWCGPPLFAWQTEALDAWNGRGRRGVIEAVTGTGKTMVGVAAAADELSRGGQVCVLVPGRDLLHQWRSVVAQTLRGDVTVRLVGDGQRDSTDGADITIAVVNSARDADVEPRRPGGLLVADECHRYGSAGNHIALRAAFPHRLGLSATYARSDDGHLDRLDPYFGGRCFQMGYRRALADGVVAPFTVALIGVRFTETEMGAYQQLGTAMAKARAMLLRRGCVRPEPVGAFLADVALAARSGGDTAGAAMAYLAAMAERRRLLAETPSKLAALAGLRPAFAAAHGALVFTRSIAAAEGAAAELLGLGIRAAPMHSALTGEVRRATLSAFAAGKLDVVTAPTVLDEGIDVPAADLAVILAASQTRRQMVQRMGRILRRKTDRRTARFAIVHVEATAEDPALGAHASFLDEVVPLARNVRDFRAGTAWSTISDYLSD